MPVPHMVTGEDTFRANFCSEPMKHPKAFGLKSFGALKPHPL